MGGIHQLQRLTVPVFQGRIHTLIMPPKEKRISPEAWVAIWVAVGSGLLSLVISLLVLAYGYGQLKTTVDDVKQDVRDIKTAMHERGMMANNQTNSNYGN